MAAKAGTKAEKPRIVPDDLEAIVREVLRGASGLKETGLKKALPKPYQPFAAEAQSVARQLAKRGEVHRVAKGKTEIYFERDPIARLDDVMPSRLPAAPFGKAALKDLISDVAPGHEVVLDEWLRNALARGILHEQSNKKQYGREPPRPPEPDIGKIFKTAFTALRKALVKADSLSVSRDRVAQMLLSELGLSSPLTGASVKATNGALHAAQRQAFLSALNAFVAENPRQALLPVRDLRSRLALSKQQFDDIALELMQGGSISLHHHDHPASLPEPERNQLVQDPRGTHYIGIALRREE